MDRRQRKSRAALTDALIALVGKKPYADITVDDVTEEADVARATFYAHFKDKTALLEATTAALIGGLTQTVDEQGPHSGTYTGGAVLATFEHADRHQRLYQLILSGEGGASCRTHLVGALTEVTTTVFDRMETASGRPARVPSKMAVLGIVGAMVLTLEHWLRGEIQGEAATVADQFVHTQMHGIGWALGYQPDEIEFRPVG